MIQTPVAARRIRKRSFLLFELLVSLALISLCLFPMIKPLAAMRKADREYLENIQLERAAQNAFCTIKTILYENKTHRWDQYQYKEEASGQLSDPFHIVLNQELTRTYQCSYTLKAVCKDCNKTSLHKSGRVVSVKIDLTSGKDTHHFYRTVYLEKQTT